MSELALLGGRKAKNKAFPEWPMYDDKERRALMDVLESRVWWRTPGTKTLEFERAFAAFHGARHGVAVTNGTAAIEVVMAALNIGPGDEVIVPDFTFIATASAALFAGALPVMVHVLPDTACIDPDLVDGAGGEIEGIDPQKLAAPCTRNGQYAYIFHVDRDAFAGISTERFIAAMNAEGIPNQASYPPLHDLDVFKTGEYRKKLTGRQAEEAHAFLKGKFPYTHRAAWETVWIPQPALLGDEEDMYEIATALKKIQGHASELAAAPVGIRETA